jgi:hypothetical protein
MLSTGLECFLESWKDFYGDGMLSTVLECFLEGWNTFLQCENAFDRFGIPLHRVEMLSRGLECFRQSWNTFVQAWNTFVQV